LLERPAALGEPSRPDYRETIPRTAVSFIMKAIPGGHFLFGSPPSERGHRPDEEPQVRIAVAPFWMGQCEVTWDEYEIFMFAPSSAAADEFKVGDAVSHPTKPYVDMSFGMGREGCPAIGMTHHAACKFTEWLSARTGRLYRLPTEAEWEYAARAGTITGYSFGDDPSQLPEYAVFGAEKYERVGGRRPNLWGLHDMHGNVAEWTLDQYLPDAYSRRAGHVSGHFWVPSASPYPHVVRGGSWADDPDRLRSAARRGSIPAWKRLDPQLPKSVWYLTSAPWVGLRLVRQNDIPSAEELYRFWNNGVAHDE
jgi:formylglycine-generating enzyme required for sulfatase activity